MNHSGYKSLAMGVIEQALRDCCAWKGLGTSGRWIDDGSKGRKDRDWATSADLAADDAREFLSRRNADLDFWCEVGGLNPDAVVRGYWLKVYRRAA